MTIENDAINEVIFENWRLKEENARLQDIVEKQFLALDSAQVAMTAWSGDWSADRKLCWVYGIIVGWEDGENYNLYDELAEKHGFDSKGLQRWKALRKALSLTTTDNIFTWTKEDEARMKDAKWWKDKHSIATDKETKE